MARVTVEPNETGRGWLETPAANVQIPLVESWTTLEKSSEGLPVWRAEVNFGGSASIYVSTRGEWFHSQYLQGRLSSFMSNGQHHGIVRDFADVNVDFSACHLRHELPLLNRLLHKCSNRILTPSQLSIAGRASR